MNDTILKVIVGSQAHGLATPESDFDYRGVFVQPTAEILKIGGTVQETRWIEGKEDDTSWEVGKFLMMATKCNPTVLEVFLAPIKDSTPEGAQLRELFPHVWNSKYVMDAFIGYGINQRKKFLEDKDGRRAKYAAAYIRTLYQAHELITTGTFTIKIADTEIGPIARKWKFGDYEVGEVIQICEDWEIKVREAYEKSQKKETNLEAVNKYLLEVRQMHW